MSDLTRREKARLEHVLEMGSGFVLDFSNQTFEEFFKDVIGINIYDGKYDRGSGSKANRMRAFWEKESNALVSAVLPELIEEMKLPGREELSGEQVAIIQEIAARLRPPTLKETPGPTVQKRKKGHPSAFISYKWESEPHIKWVRKLAEELRNRGVASILDQWEVRPGDSFTDYMHSNIAKADVFLFVITDESVRATEASEGEGGAVKFEVQMMNARRISEGTRIIGLYRSGSRPPNYLRDHRYLDFRNDATYESSLTELAETILGVGGPPPVRTPTETPALLSPHVGMFHATDFDAIDQFMLNRLFSAFHFEEFDFDNVHENMNVSERFERKFDRFIRIGVVERFLDPQLKTRRFRLNPNIDYIDLGISLE